MSIILSNIGFTHKNSYVSNVQTGFEQAMVSGEKSTLKQKIIQQSASSPIKTTVNPADKTETFAPPGNPQTWKITLKYNDGSIVGVPTEITANNPAEMRTKLVQFVNLIEARENEFPNIIINGKSNNIQTIPSSIAVNFITNSKMYDNLWYTFENKTLPPDQKVLYKNFFNSTDDTPLTQTEIDFIGGLEKNSTTNEPNFSNEQIDLKAKYYGLELRRDIHGAPVFFRSPITGLSYSISGSSTDDLERVDHVLRHINIDTEIAPLDSDLEVEGKRFSNNGKGRIALIDHLITNKHHPNIFGLIHTSGDTNSPINCYTFQINIIKTDGTSTPEWFTIVIGSRLNSVLTAYVPSGNQRAEGNIVHYNAKPIGLENGEAKPINSIKMKELEPEITRIRNRITPNSIVVNEEAPKNTPFANLFKNLRVNTPDEVSIVPETVEAKNTEKTELNIDQETVPSKSNGSTIKTKDAILTQNPEVIKNNISPQKIKNRINNLKSTNTNGNFTIVSYFGVGQNLKEIELLQQALELHGEHRVGEAIRGRPKKTDPISTVNSKISTEHDVNQKSGKNLKRKDAILSKDPEKIKEALTVKQIKARISNLLVVDNKGNHPTKSYIDETNNWVEIGLLQDALVLHGEEPVSIGERGRRKKPDKSKKTSDKRIGYVTTTIKPIETSSQPNQTTAPELTLKQVEVIVNNVAGQPVKGNVAENAVTPPLPRNDKPVVNNNTSNLPVATASIPQNAPHNSSTATQQLPPQVAHHSSDVDQAPTSNNPTMNFADRRPVIEQKIKNALSGERVIVTYKNNQYTLKFPNNTTGSLLGYSDGLAALEAALAPLGLKPNSAKRIEGNILAFTIPPEAFFDNDVTSEALFPVTKTNVTDAIQRNLAEKGVQAAVVQSTTGHKEIQIHPTDANEGVNGAKSNLDSENIPNTSRPVTYKNATTPAVSGNMIVIPIDSATELANEQLAAEAKQAAAEAAAKKQAELNYKVAQQLRLKTYPSSNANPKTEAANSESNSVGSQNKPVSVSSDPNKPTDMNVAKLLGEKLKTGGKVFLYDPQTNSKFYVTTAGANAATHVINAVISGINRNPAGLIEHLNSASSGALWTLIALKIQQIGAFFGGNLANLWNILASNQAEISKAAANGAQWAKNLFPLLMIYAAYNETNNVGKNYGFESPEYIGTCAMWSLRIMLPAGSGEVTATALELALEAATGNDLPNTAISELAKGVQKIVNLGATN